MIKSASTFDVQVCRISREKRRSRALLRQSTGKLCSPAPKYRKNRALLRQSTGNRVFRGGVPSVCEYFSQGGHADAQSRHTGHVLMIQFPTIAMTRRVHAVMRPARGARRPKTAPRWFQDAPETARRSEKQKEAQKRSDAQSPPDLVFGAFLVAS